MAKKEPLSGRRQLVLEQMAKRYGWKTGAEVGVWYGRTFFHLLETIPGLTLYGVDIWKATGFAHHKDQSANRQAVFSRLDEFDGRARILELPSIEAAQTFENGALDFVFIDADHSYEAVKQDISAWLPKVRPGGYVTGHDIDMPEVRQAVDELLPGYREDYINDCVWFWEKA